MLVILYWTMMSFGELWYFSIKVNILKNKYFSTCLVTSLVTSLFFKTFTLNTSCKWPEVPVTRINIFCNADLYHRWLLAKIRRLNKIKWDRNQNLDTKLYPKWILFNRNMKNFHFWLLLIIMIKAPPNISKSSIKINVDSAHKWKKKRWLCCIKTKQNKINTTSKDSQICYSHLCSSFSVCWFHVKKMTTCIHNTEIWCIQGNSSLKFQI